MIEAVWAGAFAFGYFVESVFGFGGGILAYSIMRFFADIKDVIVVNMFVGAFASLFILVRSRQFVRLDIVRDIAVVSLCGIAVGMALFMMLPTRVILITYSVFVIAVSVRSLFMEKFKIGKLQIKAFLFLASIIHGLLGVGGPLFVLALNERFKHKSELRSTMAAIFVIINVIRIIFLTSIGFIHPMEISGKWWILIAVTIGIVIGHRVHNKLSDELYKKLVYKMILLSDSLYLGFTIINLIFS